MKDMFESYCRNVWQLHDLSANNQTTALYKKAITSNKQKQVSISVQVCVCVCVKALMIKVQWSESKLNMSRM